MTDASRRYLPAELQNVASRLTFNSDGTFTATEYPRQDIRGDAWRTYSGRGTWSVQQLKGAGDVYLRFDDDFGGQLWMSDFMTDPPGSPTLLFFFVGDPDLGQRVAFRRDH